MGWPVGRLAPVTSVDGAAAVMAHAVCVKDSVLTKIPTKDGVELTRIHHDPQPPGCWRSDAHPWQEGVRRLG